VPYAKDACEGLAALLAYPAEDFGVRAAAAAAAVARERPEAAGGLAPLVRWAQSSAAAECEEAYVRCFDGNAERALEVGWQVFGEQYARGAFLVRLRGAHRAHGIEETPELPDHLTQVLRLLPRLAEEEARALVSAAVAPALARIRQGFAGREGDPYAGVVRAVGGVLGIGDEVAASAAPAAAGGEGP
jgi:nitrate reductase assembly molybdenum cofactor insertion protein NarJ